MRHARWRRNLAALGGLWVGLAGVTAAGTPGAPSSSAAPVPDVVIGADASAPAAGVDVRFVGLNQVEGGGLAAPDPAVAASVPRVLEATNSAVRLFTPAGGVLQTRTLNGFFGAPGAGPASLLHNPRAYFDRLGPHRRVYVLAAQRSEAPRTSRLWLAVSRSAEPADLGSARFPLLAVTPAGACALGDEGAGGYFGAQVDPGLRRFWVAGERAVTLGGTCQWQTWAARIAP